MFHDHLLDLKSKEEVQLANHEYFKFSRHHSSRLVVPGVSKRGEHTIIVGHMLVTVVEVEFHGW
jgi:hypothetical protein